MNKVDHIPHLEDLLLTPLQKHVPWIVDEMLQNLTLGKNFSIKYDGSPSLIMGLDPADGRFFLATKALFNKKPVFYKSLEEIRTQVLNPGLREALALTFKAYSPLIFRSIYQGDLMWTFNDLKVASDQVLFRTNTLTYRTTNAWMIDEIPKSTVGVMFHTRYEGTSLTDLRVSNNTEFCDVPHSEEAFSLFADLMKPAYTESEMQEQLPNIRDHFTINAYSFAIDQEVLPHLKKFLSYKLDLDVGSFLSRFIGHMSDYYMAEEDDRKSFRGRSSVRDRYNHAAEWTKDHSNELFLLYCDYMAAVKIKNWLLRQLNIRAPMGAFYSIPGALVATDQEGFVYKYQGELVKLVDRDGFTKLNRLNSLNIRR